MNMDESAPGSNSTALDLPHLPIIPVPPMYATRYSSTPVAGVSTPRLQTLVSVPFKWEEQPGKPRPCTDIIALPVNPQPAKFVLDPPPCRMMIVATKMPISPSTTVLDGPYNVGRPRFLSFRFFKRAKKHCSFDMSSSSSNSSSSQESGTVDVLLCADDDKSGGERTKMRRHGSFSKVPQTRSSTHLWAAVCRSLKQGIAWKSTGKSKKCGQV